MERRSPAGIGQAGERGGWGRALLGVYQCSDGAPPPGTHTHEISSKLGIEPDHIDRLKQLTAIR